jgi:type II secretory pathway pseudopilin PulG
VVRRPGPAARRSAGGYTLVALLVGLTVASILIASVLPLASAQAQREREAELIFRGLQYAEGIRVFRRRFGRYPNSLKELLEVKPRSVRKLWKDPMTEDGEWGIVSVAGAPIAAPGGGLPGPRPTPTPRPTPGPFPSRTPGPGEAGAAGPVMGVYSKSTTRGYRLWDGREAYNEWRFTEASLGGKGIPEGASGPGPGIGGGGGPVPPGGGK